MGQAPQRNQAAIREKTGGSSPSRRPTLSVVIITLNEEARIRECLESVKWADEIVLVDSMSTDRTVEIAADYTDKIHRHEFTGFGPQKSYALAQATGDWVLSLDADEIISPELRDEIRDRLAETGTSGYYIPRKSHFFGRWMKHSGWWPDYVLRLFRRADGAIADRLVHETIQVSGPTQKLRNPIEHCPYSSTRDIIRKQDLYTTLNARMAEDATAKGSRTARRLPLAPVGRAIARFLRTYLLRAGFLDGKEGLILAFVESHYVFLKYMKLWEGNQDQR